MFTIVLVSILLQFGFQEPKVTTLPQQSAPTVICSQLSEERESLIREAVKNHYTIRRVEFFGNNYTRDKTLRRRIRLKEGDEFTRDNLVNSLKSVSRLKKIIYPVTMDDVTVTLIPAKQMIDMGVCFKEKRKSISQ